MRLPLEHWGMLTKHANPHDRAWQNGDVRELVVLAMSLQAQTHLFNNEAGYAAWYLMRSSGVRGREGGSV